MQGRKKVLTISIWAQTEEIKLGVSQKSPQHSQTFYVYNNSTPQYSGMLLSALKIKQGLKNNYYELIIIYSEWSLRSRCNDQKDIELFMINYKKSVVTFKIIGTFNLL